MACRIQTPHGFNVPCNTYCTGDEHAVLVLGEAVCEDGFPSVPDSVIAGASAYYADLGWQILRAKRIESDRETLLATMQQASNAGAVRIEPYDTAEHALPLSLETYEPWMLILRPWPGRT